MTASETQPPQLDVQKLWLVALMTGLVAIVANLVVWAFATKVFDIQLAIPESPGSATYIDLPFYLVALVSLIATALGAGLLHLLLRYVPNPLTFFALISLGVLLASLVAPLTLNPEYASNAAKVSLVIMHVLAGVAIIGILGGTVDRFYDRTDEASVPER